MNLIKIEVELPDELVNHLDETAMALKKNRDILIRVIIMKEFGLIEIDSEEQTTERQP